MKGASNDAKKQLSGFPDQMGYVVGYKRPPKQHQFKKGQSGNPNGRPKGSRNKQPRMNGERLKGIILEEAYRTIPIQEKGRTLNIPIAQAAMRSLAVNSAKGNIRSQRLFAKLVSETEASHREEHNALMEVAIDYKLEWEREFVRCDRLGIPRPEPLPHPDHVVIDPREGTLQICGPVTKEEKAEYDKWLQLLSDFDAELELLNSELEDSNSEKSTEKIRQKIVRTERILAIFCKRLPETVVQAYRDSKQTQDS